MSLTYNVLWVDDRKDDYQEAELDIELENYIKEKFFTPNISMCETVDDAENILKTNKFDVIFSDYNITSEKKGNDFISDIRNKNINTEILFYTAQKELPVNNFDRTTFRKLDAEKGYDELLTNMKALIDLTLEKLNDLTNLRGLVISEVSELECKMGEILLSYYDTSNKELKKSRREEFDKIILSDIEKGHKDKIIDCPKDKECSHIWKTTDIREIITNPDFGSFKKAETLKIIISKYYTKQQSKSYFGSFVTNIIQERNKLAHSSTIIKEGIEYLITKDGEKQYNKDTITNIRRHIKKYEVFFSDLSKKITV